MKPIMDKSIDGGFHIQGICLAQLCHSIAAVPGVDFTYKRRFYYWSDAVFAAFTFRGQEFTIVPSSLADGWNVRPDQKYSGAAEIEEIEANVRMSCQTPWTFWESLGFRKQK
mgnify:CR=1 FL=1